MYGRKVKLGRPRKSWTESEKDLKERKAAGHATSEHVTSCKIYAIFFQDGMLKKSTFFNYRYLRFYNTML